MEVETSVSFRVSGLFNVWLLRTELDVETENSGPGPLVGW